MTVPTSAFQTYQAQGNREDLEDMFYMISPTEVPFLTMAGRKKATSTLHEWQTQALAAVVATNAQIEGDDLSTANGATSIPTVRLKNYCQISGKSVIVTDTQQAMNHAGVKNEMSFQVSLRLSELKRDMESTLVQNKAATAGSSLSARTLASVESWLTNTTGAATTGNSISIGGGTAQTTPGYASGVVSTAPTDSTTQAAITQGNLKAVIASCWTAGGSPGVILVDGTQKQVLSGFAGIATLYREAGSTAKGTAIVGAADLYISDFGEHRIVPDRFMRDQTVLVLDMDYWSVAYLRPVRSIEVARTGASMKRLIDVEYTLVAAQPFSSGKIADCA